MMEQVIKNDIILNLINKGFSMTLQKDGFILDGFYKSGTIRLEPKENGEFIAHTRYDEQEPIRCFEDLIELNHIWWKRSKGRNIYWEKPEKKWSEEMVRVGLITRESLNTF